MLIQAAKRHSTTREPTYHRPTTDRVSTHRQMSCGKQLLAPLPVLLHSGGRDPGIPEASVLFL